MTPTQKAEARFDSATFRGALGRFPTGVAIVTTLDTNADPVGMTVNSFTSVSLEPPIVLACVARKAASFPAMEQAKRYAVNILADTQAQLSTTFARSAADGVDKFASVSWTRSRGGLPKIIGSVAYLECTIVQRVEAGDHVVYLGQVDDLDVAPDDTVPLAFHQGRYATIR